MYRSNALARTLSVFLVALLWALAAATGSAAESSRFTDSLTPQQRTDAGLSALSSDNVAVINALVRQDDSTAQLRNNTVRSTRFSQRRTEHERTIAGLDRLTSEQISKLDDLVGRRFAPPPSPLLESPITLSGLSISPMETNSGPRAPEIHGSFTLTYGWGKGGSVKGGDATLFYQDPEHRFSVLFNYSEYHGKGSNPWLYPGYSYPGDVYPVYRPLPESPLPDRE